MRSPLPRLAPIAIALALAAAGAVQAHSDAYLDTQKGAGGGGQLRAAGLLHLELVVATAGGEAAQRPVVVHVTDHAGTQVPTAGARGTVTIVSGRTKTTIELTPDGDNRLKGVGRYAPGPGMKAVVAVTLAGQPVEQARFTPTAPSGGPDGHDGHGHRP